MKRVVVSPLLSYPTVLTVCCQCHSPPAASKLRRTAKNDSLPQTPRQSPRLQEIRDLNQQRISRAGKRTRSSAITAEAHCSVAQQQPQAKCGILGTSRKCWLDFGDIVVYTADQRSRTTRESRVQRREATDILPNEPRSTKELLVTIAIVGKPTMLLTREQVNGDEISRTVTSRVTTQNVLNTAA